MLLAPLLVLVVHLLQHLLDGVDHQHEVYPSLRSPASTKAVVRVEADGQRLSGRLAASCDLRRLFYLRCGIHTSVYPAGLGSQRLLQRLDRADLRVGV